MRYSYKISCMETGLEAPPKPPAQKIFARCPSGKTGNLAPPLYKLFRRPCSLKEKLRLNDFEAYDIWKKGHRCNYNYSGSGNGMEVEGAKRIFSRLIKRLKVRYKKLYGDRDSKSHQAVMLIYKGRIV